MTFRIDTVSIHRRYLVVTVSQVQLIVVESFVPKRLAAVASPIWLSPAIGLHSRRFLLPPP
jgi:hypothetical protein